MLPVIFLAVGCGINRPDEGSWQVGSWPAKVKLSGFDAYQSSEVTTAIAWMNKQAGKEIITVKETGDGYPITVKLSAGWPDALTRAGLATASNDDCLIELNDFLFTEAHQAERVPAIAHEFGHCAGFHGHDSDSQSIMYAQVKPMSKYSAQNISSFFSRFLNSVGLSR